ncbi:MAG TPA: response regulator [Candidatus Sulfomarinibacteraceae bacterium]|nr:response regulator [Candidatus Sulfomarinibacteraceae bacterium]
MTKILVIDDDPNVQRLLRVTLKQEGFEVIVAGDGAEGLRLWETDKPALILLDVTLPKIDGYEVATSVRGAEAAGVHTPIIMLTAEKEVEQKVRGLRAGADDYLVKPFHQAELLARMKSLLARFGSRDGVSGLRPPLGKLLAFYGAKGGVGTTTLAINTAIALHQEGARRVALVDGVLQFGDHRVFLDLGTDRKSISDVVSASAIDADLMKSIVVRHDSGIDLLLAPPNPEDGDLVHESHMGQALAQLRSMYDYVVVDVEKRLGDVTLSVLDHADLIFVVMTADLSCLKNVRLVLEALGRVGYEASKVKLVLNRSNAFTGISVQAAEGALKRQFDYKISNEYRVAISAQNSGTPFAFSKPDSPLAREVGQIATSVDRVAEPPAKASAKTPAKSGR